MSDGQTIKGREEVKYFLTALQLAGTGIIVSELVRDATKVLLVDGTLIVAPAMCNLLDSPDESIYDTLEIEIMWSNLPRPVKEAQWSIVH